MNLELAYVTPDRELDRQCPVGRSVGGYPLHRGAAAMQCPTTNGAFFLCANEYGATFTLRHAQGSLSHALFSREESPNESTQLGCQYLGVGVLDRNAHPAKHRKRATGHKGCELAGEP